MSDKEKRLLIVGGLILAVLFFLFMRKGEGNTIVNQEGGTPINVDIPSVNLPPRDRTPIVIPPLGPSSGYDFDAISSCMCGGSTIPNYIEREKVVEKTVETKVPVYQRPQPVNVAQPETTWFRGLVAGSKTPWYYDNPYFRG